MTQARTPAKKTAASRTAAKKATVAARSATAKKAPADRRAPAAAKKDSTTKVPLRGVDWVIDPTAADDFELLEDLSELDRTGDPSRMPSVLRRILGDDQYRKAMDTLRDQATGRVSLEDGITFVWELMEGLNPNSSSS